MSRAEKKEIKKQKKEGKRQEKEAKKEARAQRRMEKKVGRNVWVEVDTDEMSLDNPRNVRYDDPGVELSSLDNSRYDLSEGREYQGYGGSARV